MTAGCSRPLRNATDCVWVTILLLLLPLSLSLPIKFPLSRLLPCSLGLRLLLGLQNFGKFMILSFNGKFPVRVITFSQRELFLKRKCSSFMCSLICSTELNLELFGDLHVLLLLLQQPLCGLCCPDLGW